VSVWVGIFCLFFPLFDRATFGGQQSHIETLQQMFMFLNTIYLFSFRQYSLLIVHFTPRHLLVKCKCTIQPKPTKTKDFSCVYTIFCFCSLVRLHRYENCVEHCSQPWRSGPLKENRYC
jgi:hypothetical protein